MDCNGRVENILVQSVRIYLQAFVVLPPGPVVEQGLHLVRPCAGVPRGQGHTPAYLNVLVICQEVGQAGVDLGDKRLQG